MRAKKVYKTLLVTEDVHKRIMGDREHFEKTIKGGTWSVSDTITEYHKILNTLKK